MVAGYCFDTSALIECWARSYPPDVVPGLWDKLSTAIAFQYVQSPDEVRVELVVLSFGHPGRVKWG